MNEYEASGVMVLLFALRCVAPFVLLMGVGYLMNHMVDKWEHETQTQEAQKKAAQPQPQEGKIFPENPGIIQPAFVKAPLEKKPIIQLPCWMIKSCDPVTRPDCAAHQQQGKPCWVARLAAESVLPAGCPDCPVYQMAHV